MSQARDVTASFTQLQPPSFQVRCGAQTNSVQVVRLTNVDCVLVGTPPPQFATGVPFTATPSGGGLLVRTENTVIFEGYMLWTTDVSARVFWRRSETDTGTVNAGNTATITVTARQNFPTVSLGDAVDNVVLTGEYSDAGSDTLGWARAIFTNSEAAQWSAPPAAGPNRDFTVLTSLNFHGAQLT
jgi:hypothetical protein